MGYYNPSSIYYQIFLYFTSLFLSCVDKKKDVADSPFLKII